MKDYSKMEKCYFCGVYLTSRMSRHIERKHYKEVLVDEALKSDDNRRGNLLRRIQNLGNFVHNTNVSNINL